MGGYIYQQQFPYVSVPRIVKGGLVDLTWECPKLFFKGIPLGNSRNAPLNMDEMKIIFTQAFYPKKTSDHVFDHFCLILGQKLVIRQQPMTQCIKPFSIISDNHPTSLSAAI